MKKIYSTLLTLIAFTGLTAQPGNYLVNAGFEDDFRGWHPNSGTASTVTYSIETAAPLSGAKSAKMEITGTGTANWESALQQRLTVHKGKEVTVSFLIKASTNTFVNLEVCRGYGDYDPIIRSEASIGGASPNIAIGTTVDTLSYTVTPQYSDANYIFSLMLGTTPTGVTVWIDDVQIRQTDKQWDGNIMPNSELDEIWTRDPSLPAERTAQLAFSTTPWLDGGFEGGFADVVAFPTLNVNYGVDSTSKLSGKNSFVVNVINKSEAGEFWGSANFIYFRAHEGESYEFSMEVMASQASSFSVAMNEEPWAASGGDHFFSAVNATSSAQTFTIQSGAFLRGVDTTLLHKIFMANFPAGQNYKIWMDNIRLIRANAADTANTSGIEDRPTLFSRTNVFPVPSADGNFNIDFSESRMPIGAAIEASILSLDGKEVYRTNFTNNGAANKLTPNLGAGTYVLRAVYEDQVLIKKVIVK